MAVLTTTYDATADTITITLASLGNGSWRQSAAFDNGTDQFVDAIIGGQITTGTSPTAGTIDVYLYGTFDNGTTYTGGASGSDAAYTADGEETLFKLVEAIANDTTSDQGYVFGPVSVASFFGGILPEEFGIVVENNSGVALNATGGNHFIKFTGVKYTST